ncbi:DUF202 domain-containing protein [Streptomyces halobius]|uniref:DUF202 domain-containing protein n=1 Tax=Streptomyces halobius TaxID=2879846 RepID=A0ABY4MF48_9ACTN|nr:DUF202 domain-containing protein [Streptomyces halobius]UQA96327.1 DUF202 domain-containing protein [Streptomyces halobius]
MGDGHRPGARPRIPVPDRDPGLQPERTRLAWRRTTLTCSAVVALGERALLRSGAPGPVVVVLAALMGLVWAVFVAASDRRIRSMATGRPPELRRRLAWVLAGCTLVLAVLGAAVVPP